MFDGITWRDEIAADQSERRKQFAAYLRQQLVTVQERRSKPQTRDDHAALAGREAHYIKLLGRE